MRIAFRLPGVADSPTLEIERSFWSQRSRLWLDGRELPRQSERSEPFTVTLPDGSTKQVRPKSSLFDFVPRVFVDGEEVVLARRLRWYEKIPVYIPILRGLLGGLVGWILGFGTAFLVLRLLRSDKPATLKVLGVIGLNLACLLAIEIVGLGLITLISQFR